MEVIQCKAKLGQNEVQVYEKKNHIRCVQLPGKQCYYYSRQNMLIQLVSFELRIFVIGQYQVVLDKELTFQTRQKFAKAKLILPLENQIVISQNNQLIKFNLNNFEQQQILQGSLPQNIYKLCQINGKSAVAICWMDNRLIIYSLRNFKKSLTSLNKFRINSTQYYKHIVQAFGFENLYYYNTRMTKQIRKYKGFLDCEPTFNSNYLITPIKSQNVVHLIIYDIQSMKTKGPIKLYTDRSLFQYSSCIFIRDFNVIGVLYSSKLDLYDFTTLKCINSEEIPDQYNNQSIMRYDEFNGLTLFFQISGYTIK